MSISIIVKTDPTWSAAFDALFHRRLPHVGTLVRVNVICQLVLSTSRHARVELVIGTDAVALVDVNVRRVLAVG